MTVTYSAPNELVDELVPLDRIRPSSFNPRKRFDEAALRELAGSIREHGLLEPIVVRPIVPPAVDERLVSEGLIRLGDFLADFEKCREQGVEAALRAIRQAESGGGSCEIDIGRYVGRGWPSVRAAIIAVARDNGLLAEVGESGGYPEHRASLTVRPMPKYEIVAGERRWRACKLAGLTEISVRVHPSLDDEQALRLAIIENVQRVDLDPIEEAAGYAQLAKLGMRQSEIAAAVNRQQPTVANRMRLLELPESVQAKITAGELSASHGIALASYKVNSHVQETLAELAVAEMWPSKKLEGYFSDAYYLPGELMEYVYEFRGAGVFDWEHECRGACPHNAFRANSRSFMGWCLQPVCFEQKVRAAKEAQAAALEEKIQQAQATGTPIDKARDLGYDGTDYHTIYSHTRLPAGCQAGCEKRVRALDGGNVVVEICSDAKCWKRLEMAATKTANKKGRNRAKEMLAEMEKSIDGLWAFGGKEMAVIAALAMSDYHHLGKPLEDTLARHGLDDRVCKAIKNERYDASHKAVTWNRYDVLSECSPLTLARVIIEVAIRRESQNLAESPQGASTPIADWWLRTNEPAPSAESPAAEPEPEESIGNHCGLSATHSIRHTNGTAFACKFHLEATRHLEGAREPEQLDPSEWGKIKCRHVYGPAPEDDSAQTYVGPRADCAVCIPANCSEPCAFVGGPKEARVE